MVEICALKFPEFSWLKNVKELEAQLPNWVSDYKIVIPH